MRHDQTSNSKRHRALLVLACGLLASGSDAIAQRNRQRVPNRAAIVERPAAIENLLKRAADGIARQDWKLAIDSLQRVIDDPVSGLVELNDPPDGDLNGPSNDDSDTAAVYYRSARDEAMAMLAQLPPEGLESYRVLHDGRGAAMYEQAVEAADMDMLRDVVDRYFFTTVGVDAATELAGWHLDRGNYAGALNLIQRIDRMKPGGARVSPRGRLIHAVALAGLGLSKEAHDVLNRAEQQAITDSTANHDAGADINAAFAAVNEAIRDRSFERRGDIQTEKWPMLGGGVTRRGTMAEVSPELREGLPWRLSLPSSDADWWETQGISQAREKVSFAAAGAVIDQGRVFVKSSDQVSAMDLESLEPLWTTDAPVSIGRRRDLLPDNRNIFRGTPTDMMRGMTDADQRLYDVVAGTVSTAFGMVYSIERDGVGPLGVVGRLRRGAVVEGTRLVALNAGDGFIAWERGRTGDSDDELDGVYFLSPPIAVRDELWVPFAKAGDIFLAALSPADGRLLRKRLLCSAELSQIASQYHEAMYLASDGNRIFVSTGFGLIIAMDVDGFRPVWTTQYNRDVGTRRRTSYEPRFWHCTPPVVAGAQLIVAAVDSDALMALDTNTGLLLWRRPRPDGAFYIMGVDDHRIWLGGSGAYCLSADDGSQIWEASEPLQAKVTGRGALSGSKIYLPLMDSVAVLNSQTGDALSPLPLPEDQLPLGNLLCAASAMFSVDTNEVRKFPDLTLSYPRQLALFERRPRDHNAAIRLAWMELLRDEPDKAFAVLDQLPPSPVDSTRQQVARLKVKSLLKMSSATDDDRAVAIEHLREALGLAQLVGADRERLEAAVHLASRLEKNGQLEEAYLTLWRTGISDAADGYLTIAPRLRQQARWLLAERMARMDRELSARHLSAIAEQTQAEFAKWREPLRTESDARDAVVHLERLARLNDAGGAGQAALIELAKYERDRNNFERSEQYFRWAIRVNRVARLTATAKLELAAQYLHPAQALYESARTLLADGLDRFDDVVIDETNRTLGEERARLSLALDGQLPMDAARDAPDRFSFVPDSVIEEYQWMQPPGGGSTLLDYSTADSDALGRFVLTITQPNVVEAYRSTDGSLAWRADVLPLNENDVQLPELVATNRTRVFPRVFCDGQTAVFNGPGGLYGVGLATGRRLWAASYEEEATEAQYALRNRLVAVSDGVVVFAPRRGVLTAASVADADDIIWERIIAGDKLDTVFVEDGLCVTLNASRRTARTYDLHDGRMLSEVQFRRGHLDDIVKPLVYVDGILIGPDGLNKLIAFDLRSGTEAWRFDAGDEIRWMFGPGKGHVGLWTLSGSVILLDAFDGAEVLRLPLADMDDHLAEGVIADDVLVLMPVGRANRGPAPVLYGIDLNEKRVRWVRDGFEYTGPKDESLWRLLKVSDDVVPMPIWQPVKSENNFIQATGNAGLVCIDKQTGRNTGPIVLTGRAANDAEHLTGDFAIYSDRVIFGTQAGLMSIGIESK